MYEAYMKYGIDDMNQHEAEQRRLNPHFQNYDGTAYTYCQYLATTMRKFCGEVIAVDSGTPEHVTGRIINSIMVTKKPIIVLTNWKLGGGHFVLIDHISQQKGSKYYACVCDPWDRDVRSVEIKPGVATSYDPVYPTVSKQGVRFPGGANAGNFSAWTVEFTR